MKQKTSKLAKLERNRKSILTDELDCCWFCGRQPVDLHEIYAGANRKASMRNDFVVPLCRQHHQAVQLDSVLSNGLKRLCQETYEKTHTREEFMKIIKRNYL